jgi:hypothetical protein
LCLFKFFKKIFCCCSHLAAIAQCNKINKYNVIELQLLGLEDSREVVYGTLDAWVAFEQDFPLPSLRQALSALEKEEQWHRIVQVLYLLSYFQLFLSSMHSEVNFI